MTAKQKPFARLTDQAVKAAKPATFARDIADGTVAGLSLRVTPQGHKSWTLRAKWRGDRVRVDLGEYPTTSLAEARELATAARKLADRGDNPELAVRPYLESVDVSTAINDWLESKKDKRSVEQERRRLEIYVVPDFGRAPVKAVTHAELAALLHAVAFKGKAVETKRQTKPRPKPVEANRLHTSLSAFFHWCHKNGLRGDNPAALLVKPVDVEPSAVRRREGTEPLLDMTELARLWSRAPELPGAVLGDLLRCLLLVPLRREEWTGLRWTERKETFTGDGWSGAALRLPADRMKGRRLAVVPLSTKAAEILDARHKITGHGKYVFAVPGRDTPFAGWRRGADTLRAALGAGLPDDDVRNDWSPHTIRASVATAMVRDLGADELLVGRILQHSPRSALGITDTYQRSQRLVEQADLLERWSEHLQAVAASVAAPEADAAGRVVSLRRVVIGE
jgi:integrase